MSQRPISHADINAFLCQYPSWRYEGDALHAEYKFEEMTEVWAFLNRLAALQEKHNHHAEIFNLYKTVRLRFTTHDSGHKITQKDLDIIKDLENDSLTALD